MATLLIARRLSGLTLSAVIHLVILLALAVLPARERGSNTEGPNAGIDITYLAGPDAATASSRDRPLAAEPESTDPGPSERVDAAGYVFDLSKIRARRDVLFPFLTLDLMFLDRVDEDILSARQRLVNPYASGRRGASRPPLSMSEAGLEQAIDRAWSRRERWRQFAEIAALAQAHDPDEGGLPALVRAYLDQNILQPFCDTAIRDPRFWAMLENAADHVEFIDFVRRFTRDYPSSRTTTELLFLLDELVQGSRDVLVMLIDTNPARDLRHTWSTNREGYDLAVALQFHYAGWLSERQIDSLGAIKARYDQIRLRLLSTIVESTPDAYRSGDARYLAGEILFNQGNMAEALRWWRGIAPDAAGTYANGYSKVLDALGSPRGAAAREIRRILEGEAGRWRTASIDRLRRFGYSCDTF